MDRREEHRAAPRRRFEALETRELLSGQPFVITDAAPYSAAYVNGVYRDALGRTADAIALDLDVAQIDQGMPQATVPLSVAGSSEYATRLVQSAYQQYLGRDADPASLTFWVTAMHSGFRDEQLVAALVASDEFYLHAGGTDTAWITAAYEAILGRAPEPTAVAWATSQLAQDGSRDTVAHDLAASLERERQVVRADYAHFLNTTPDDGALNWWATRLADGDTTNEVMVAGLMGSNAYYEAQTGVPPSVVPVSHNDTPAWAGINEQIDAQAAQGGAPVLFLGDSLTERWLAEGNATWNQDFASLNAVNEGIGGDTTQNVLWRIENGGLNGLSPKVVVLMIGVNNFATGESPHEVAAGVTAVVDALHERLPQTKILLLSILPVVLSGPGGNFMPTIAATNQLISGLADEQNVFYLDLWPAFTNANGTTRPELHLSDGLHLDAAGYAVLAQSISPELDNLLNLR